MNMYLPAPGLRISSETSKELEAFAKDRRNPKALTQRCWIVLMAAEGIGNSAIARVLNVSRVTVLLWRQRFEIFGKRVLLDSHYSLPGRRRIVDGEERRWIQDHARCQLQQGKSLREISLQLNLSKSSLHRILNETTET